MDSTLISAGIGKAGKKAPNVALAAETPLELMEMLPAFFALNVCPLYAHRNRNGAVFHHYDDVGVLPYPVPLDVGAGRV